MAKEAEPILEIKRTMRRAAIDRRKNVESEERSKASIRLVTNAKMLLADLTDDSMEPTSLRSCPQRFHRQKHSALQDGDTAAAYVSMGTEVPTLELLDELVAQGLRVLVPRLGSGRDIGWSEYAGENGLCEMPHTITGGLRPEEPSGTILRPEAIADAKLVFIPAFAVDLDGTRLGRGGGWYDQVLGLCRPDALKIGVCWDWEFIDRHDAVPHETHDIPVDAVITPERQIQLH